MFEDWKTKTQEFKTIDVRGIQGNFFPGIKKQALQLNIGQGLEIIQSFEPHPLYAALEALGFEHHTERTGENEFHAYFYRTENKDEKENAPFKPLALLNYPVIDEGLGSVAADFWNLTWNDEKRYLHTASTLFSSVVCAGQKGHRAERYRARPYSHCRR